MTSPKNVLLIGGHGKVSLLMTPLLTSRSLNLTSMIRNPEQKSAILEAGNKGPGKIDVLVESLEDVKTESDAKKILDKVKPDWVIWSAGAGGKGGVSRTYAIDQDACCAFIKASVKTPSITKFLLVSSLLSRRNKASWWDDKAWAEVRKVWTEVMPDYCKAKLVSDECLTALGEERRDKSDDFEYIVFRPGALTDDDKVGKVGLGKTQGRGKVTRSDVADVGVRLLESGANGWFDLIEGDEATESAVRRVIDEKVNAMDGEDVEVMKKNMI